MCFSAEASVGVAVALLPVGAYCAEAAWRKDPAYLPLAAIPTLFGVQQLSEAGVWVGFGRGDPALVRAASVWFLFFALALWPVWVPLAVAAIEPRGARRRALVAIAGLGLGLGCVYYLPLAGGIGWADVRIVDHSIRYDFSAIPAVRAAPGWVWPVWYLGVVGVPLLASAEPRLRPLGVAVGLSAFISYVMFEYTFASVWCFFAAAMSAYIGYVLYRLPDRSADNPADREALPGPNSPAPAVPAGPPPRGSATLEGRS